MSWMGCVIHSSRVMLGFLVNTNCEERNGNLSHVCHMSLMQFMTVRPSMRLAGRLHSYTVRASMRETYYSDRPCDRPEMICHLSERQQGVDFAGTSPRALAFAPAVAPEMVP